MLVGAALIKFPCKCKIKKKKSVTRSAPPVFGGGGAYLENCTQSTCGPIKVELALSLSLSVTCFAISHRIVTRGDSLSTAGGN